MSVSYQNRACSGATTKNLYKDTQALVDHKTTSLHGNVTSKDEAKRRIAAMDPCRSQNSDEHSYSRYVVDSLKYQNSRSQTLVSYRCERMLRLQSDFIGPETDFILLTIGGNNFGFRRIIEECFFWRNSTICKEVIGGARAEAEREYGRELERLLAFIKSRGLRSDAKIVLLGYPLLSLDNNISIGVGLNRINTSQAVRELGQYSNEIAKRSISEFNKKHPNQALFVDAQSWFAGHEPDNRFLTRNPKRWLNDFFEPLTNMNEWYHPNKTGHQQYANLLKHNSLLKNFTNSYRRSPSDIDVVFNIDTTGSMWTSIEAFKASALATATMISKSSSSVRYALVDFRDFPGRSGTPYDYPAKLRLDFTSDINKLKDAVNNLSTGDGGDGPESMYSGLITGINLNWRPAVHKIIITLSDNGPLDPEPVTGYTKKAVIEKAFKVDPASLYFIHESPVRDEYVDSMAEESGGSVIVNDNESISIVSDAIRKIINETLDRPFAWINGPYLAKIGEAITIDGGGSYAKAGQIVKYEWDWESDGIYDNTTTTYNITRSWNKELDGLMTLRVTDSNGLVNTANTWLTVSIDGDTVNQEIDNCPLVANQSQSDHDVDGIGNECDEDYMPYILGELQKAQAKQNEIDRQALIQMLRGRTKVRSLRDVAEVALILAEVSIVEQLIKDNQSLPEDMMAVINQPAAVDSTPAERKNNCSLYLKIVAGVGAAVFIGAGFWRYRKRI